MRLLYALTIFIGAFLLFQVQPLIGKHILPWFGNMPSVWATCLLFFQVMLLGGYAYAHFISSRLRMSHQVFLHVALILGALLLLPIDPSPSWKPSGDINPTLQIFALLATTVGVPYLLLSSTSPLLQRWYSQAHEGASPYRLYAVSNAGSLLALLSYPFFFERIFRLKSQTWLWSLGFGAFALLTAWIAWRLLSRTENAAASQAQAKPANPSLSKLDESPPSIRRILLWLALSATGSTLLVATTNRMAQDVPAVPFLFILPLSIYLVTFIIAFDSPRWYLRPVFCLLLPIGIAGACFEIFQNVELELNLRVVLYSVALFACAMCCHGELARLKPSPKHLTHFYLMVSLGGALGGLFVAVGAPLLFKGLWEYEIGLVAAFVLVMSLVGADLIRRSRNPKITGSRKARKRALNASRANRVPPAFAWSTVAFSAVALCALLVALWKGQSSFRGNLLAHSRNFYGVLQIVESELDKERLHKHKLYHGNIRHGFQYWAADKRRWKTSYYGDNSGVGVAISRHPQRSNPGHQFRVGVIGLGAGTIAAFANDATTGFNGSAATADYQRYYEIDRTVLDYASEYFSFIEDARARGATVHVSLGDARIEMERQIERGEFQNFDVLAIDAFSGDSVPMHLLTDEAFQIYRRHMQPGGIIAFHISSRYLDLLPVVRGLAGTNGWSVRYIYDAGDQFGRVPSRWALISANPYFLEQDSV
ncbi:MAG: spermidine synthase, partial [Verrucomicrobiales bacterium]